MKFFGTAIIGLLLALSTSCNAHYGFGNARKTIWIPYIEDIQFPADIHVGEVFTFRFTLSAETNPQLLDDAWVVWRLDTGDIGSYAEVLNPYLSAVPHADGQAPGPATTKLDVQWSFDKAGTYKFTVASTQTKAQGGLAWEVPATNFRIAYEQPPLTAREITIEVLP